MRYPPRGSYFAASIFLHAVAFLLASTLIGSRHNLPQNDLISVSLIETRQAETPAQLPAIQKPLPAPPKSATTNKPIPSPTREAVKTDDSNLPTAAREDEKPVETKPLRPAPPEQTTTDPSPATADGGSQVGAGNPFGNGDVDVVPGDGTSGGGDGTAASGLARGSGAPGFPTPATMLKTNREAKPIQTARASYPPMALRMGLESDVTLRIEVDTKGHVTKAEITKSGGTGFDEEALRAVKQSRFEPAQKNGATVPAEFTYIYRFRLQR